MEKHLTTWIEDQTQKCIPLSTTMIMAKEKSLFSLFKEKTGPDYNAEFIAKWFKNRYSLDNVQVSGEPVAIDMKAAEEYLETLGKLIVEEIYLPEQIFNMDCNLPIL